MPIVNQYNLYDKWIPVNSEVGYYYDKLPLWIYRKPAENLVVCKRTQDGAEVFLVGTYYPGNEEEDVLKMRQVFDGYIKDYYKGKFESEELVVLIDRNTLKVVFDFTFEFIVDWDSFSYFPTKTQTAAFCVWEDVKTKKMNPCKIFAASTLSALCIRYFSQDLITPKLGRVTLDAEDFIIDVYTRVFNLTAPFAGATVGAVHPTVNKVRLSLEQIETLEKVSDRIFKKEVERAANKDTKFKYTLLAIKNTHIIPETKGQELWLYRDYHFESKAIDYAIDGVSVVNGILYIHTYNVEAIDSQVIADELGIDVADIIVEEGRVY